MEYRRRNFMTQLPKFESGDVFIECCFAQKKKNTEILPSNFDGKITCIDCNLHNVNIDERINHIGCLTVQYDIVDEEPPRPDKSMEAIAAIEQIGADALLEAIGKDVAMAKWNLKDAVADKGEV